MNPLQCLLWYNFPVMGFRKLLCISIIFLVFHLQACESTVTNGGRLKVLTTIAPLYSYAVNVAGGTAVIDNLIPSGAGPHEYSLSPGDARKIAETDVLIINGVRLESWLDKVVRAAQELRGPDNKIMVIDTSSGVEIIDTDPHIWLSPKNAVIQVENIRDGLTKVDPANGETYRKNADAYIQRLTDLDKEITEKSRGWKTRKFIAFHSAFRYFARDYGLTQLAVIQENPESEPSPRHIASVIEIIKANGIRSIFTEPQFSHKIVESLAKDLHLKIYSIDTMGTGTFSRGWYEERMKENVAVFEKALH